LRWQLAVQKSCQIPIPAGEKAVFNRDNECRSVHRTLQRWVRTRVFDHVWAALIEACSELGGVNWEWQAADGATGKARLGRDRIGPNPTDRGKAGVKRSLLVEAGGGPLGMVVAGANVHDTKLLAPTLEAVVVERPEPTEEAPQHLCLDKGYDNPTGRGAVAAHHYVPHIRRIGEGKLHVTKEPRHPARRWVVERTQYG
jgi:putative transposase